MGNLGTLHGVGRRRAGAVVDEDLLHVALRIEDRDGRDDDAGRKRPSGKATSQVLHDAQAVIVREAPRRIRHDQHGARKEPPGCSLLLPEAFERRGGGWRLHDDHQTTGGLFL